MIHNGIHYDLCGWRGIGGGIATRQDWSLWAQNKLDIAPILPEPQLEVVPTRISRRLDILGRCVMSVCEQCMPLLKTEPAIIAVSRHGNLTSMNKLIQCVRDREDISPTAFTYSVHNRLSSLISMFFDYRGVNGAYSSTRDGFPLALAEAVTLITKNQVDQALIVAYEDEIPETHHPLISTPWTPHAAAFVLQKSNDTKTRYSLLRHASELSDANMPDSGSCLPFIKTMLTKTKHRDGCWEYQYNA